MRKCRRKVPPVLAGFLLFTTVLNEFAIGHSQAKEDGVKNGASDNISSEDSAYGRMSRQSVETSPANRKAGYAADEAEFSAVPFWGLSGDDERAMASGEQSANNRFKNPASIKRASADEADYKLVCYVMPDPLSASKLLEAPSCTHYVIVDVVPYSDYLNHESNGPAVRRFPADALRLRSVRKRLAGAKMLLGVGGWLEGTEKIFPLIQTERDRRVLARSLKKVMMDNAFDGLDLYMVLAQAQPRYDHQDLLGQFIRILKEEIGDSHTLSALVSAPNRIYQHADALYDVQALRRSVGWISVAAYDLDDPNRFPAHHSPLRLTIEAAERSHGDVVSAVSSWLSAGFEPWKIVMATPLFARNHGENIGSSGKPGYFIPHYQGWPKVYERSLRGATPYSVVCQALQDGSTLDGSSSIAKIIGGPFVHSKGQWLSYDSIATFTEKMAYVTLRGLGGAALVYANFDDVDGQCGPPWPFLSAASRLLSNPRQAADVFSNTNGLHECQIGRDGYYRHEGNCSVVTKCDSGIATVIRCPDGLSYNPSAQLCEPSGCQSTKQNEKYLQRGEGDSNDKVVFCYLANWARLRRADGRFVPENLEAGLCTHVIYSYFKFDPAIDAPATVDIVTDFENDWLKRLTSLKERLGFKVLLGIGGWADSSRSDKYSVLVSDPSRRTKFAGNSIKFLEQHDLDGIHIEWQYPKCWQNKCESGPATDKSGFANLVKEIREVFDARLTNKPPYTISVAVAGTKEIIDEGYDLQKLSNYAHYLVAHTMAYYGPWESNLGHLSPLYGEDSSVDSTITYMQKKGAAMDKVVLTVPGFGYSFYVDKDDSESNKPGAEAMGPGRAAQYTQQPGFMSYLEICSNVGSGGWKKIPGSSRQGPYAYGSGSWVSFDDEDSIAIKADYIKQKKLAGAALWSIDLDDFKNLCCRRSFPLVRSLNVALGLLPSSAMLAKGMSDCSKPEEPVTPPPPSQTTTYSSGSGDEISKPTTYAPPTTIHQHHQPPTTTKPTTLAQTVSTTTYSPKPPQPTVSLPSSEFECNFSGQMKPDPVSCEVFMRCENGVWVQRQCPPGLHFSASSGLCDYKYRAGCLPDATTKSPFEITLPTLPPTTTTTTTTRRPTTTTRTTTTTTQRPTTTTTTQRPTTTTGTTTTTEQQFFDCQYDGQRDVDYQHCAAYRECKRRRWVKRWCPPGTEYVNQLKACYPPGPTSTCYQGQSPPYPGHLPQPQEPYRPLPYPSGSIWIPGWPTTAFDPPQQLPGPAIPQCQVGQVLATPDSCSSFLECNTGGQFVPKSCPPGLRFDATVSRCDWSYRVLCYYKAGSNEIEASSLYSACSSGSYQKSKKCEDYEECVQGVWIIRKCPVGLHYSEKLKSCTWPAEARCQESGKDLTSIITNVISNQEKPSPPVKEPSLPSNLPQVDPTDLGFPKVTATSSKATSGDYKLVCYFTNWAWYRNGKGKFMPEDIDEKLCTHIVYGFAVLDPYNLVMKPHDPWADFDNKFYERVNAFQKKGIKVLIAIGGWNDSEGNKYSRLVNDPAARAKFVTHVVEFIEKHGFNGLDLDWEYPKCWQVDCKKGPDSDKDGFSAWVKELRAAFKPKGLLLSAAVSPSKKVIDAGYDVPVMAENLDWIAVMTYDFHGHWDKQTGHVAPLFYHPDDEVEYFNSDAAIKHWMKRGAPAKKLVMGMPLYGQSFTLSNVRDTGLNSKAGGKGEAGRYTRAAGFLAYYEICEQILKEGWTIKKDPELRMGPFAHKGAQWVSFDDVAIIAKKTQYVKDTQLGGAMVWALDLDDFRNICGQGQYPLLNTIKSGLLNESPSVISAQGASKPVATLTTTMGPTSTAKTPPKPTTTPQATFTEKAPSTTMASNVTVTTTTEKVTSTTTELTTSSAATPSSSVEECTGFLSRADMNDDCKSYRECVHGKWVSRPCGAGTYFSKAVQSCTTLAASDCAAMKESQTMKPTSAAASETSSASTMKSTTTTTTMSTPKATTTAVASVVSTTTEPPSTYVEVSGDWKPTKPNEAIVVCYFTNWAWYRQGLGKYKPEDIDPSLCTHIQYGFAVLDYTELVIRIHDSWADVDNKFYEKVVAYKSKGIKVLLALGGWNDSAGDKYSRMVNNPAARKKFVEHSVGFLEKYGFDGLDLDWEYPKCWQVDCKKGPESDKAAFTELVKELKAAFEPKGWLLTAAVSPNKKVIDAGYDVPALSKYFDFISVMTYDYHGEWDKKTGHNAPMFYHPEDDNVDFNTNYTIHYWIAKGAPRNKLVLGMPLYGRSFTLADSSVNGLNAKTYGNGEAGPYTRAGGFLAYYEICDFVKNRNWKVERKEAATVGPYAYSGGQWVSFDDADALKFKSQWALDMGLAGGMVWALDLDDFKNVCGCEAHPLLRTINRVMRPDAIESPDPKCPKLGGNGFQTSFFKTDSHSLIPMSQLQCNEGSTLKNEMDASSFYTCHNGTYMLMYCSPGFTWDDFLATCVTPTSYIPSWNLPLVEYSWAISAPPTTRVSASSAGLQITPNSFAQARQLTPEEVKVVCYVTNWARYRESNSFVTSVLNDLEGNLCTHVIHAFATLDAKSLTMKARRMRHSEGFDDDIKALKKRGVKVLASLGGWGDSSTDKYSRLVASPQSRADFVENAVAFLKQYGFDGLDLDWEFPVCWQNNCKRGAAVEKEQYVKLAMGLREAFSSTGFLLSMAVSPREDVIEAAFDIPALSKVVDWFNVLAFDYNGPDPRGEQPTHLAPLYPTSDQKDMNADYTIKKLLEKGASRQQLVLGVPFQANTVKILGVSRSGINNDDDIPAVTVTRGDPGAITQAPGILGYFEICRKVEDGQWVLVPGEEFSKDPGPFALNGKQWTSFEGPRNVRKKAEYILSNNLGGMMLWGLDLDDFKGHCKCGQMPLLKTATSALHGLPAGYQQCE